MEATKKQLRRTMRGHREAMSASSRARRSADACGQVLSAIPLSGVVGIYRHIGAELDTAVLHEGICAAGGTVCYPRCEPQSMRLVFCVVPSPTDLRPGFANIREPQPKHEVVLLSGLAAVVVPGLAFDRHGGRLGYGAGFYDRTLVGYHGLVVGLCFARQVVEFVPQGSHDQRMQLVVHEGEIITVGATEAAVTGSTFA